MAVIKPGSIVADIRGRVGDNVFTRTQGGATVRSVGSWVQPDSDPQVLCRDTIEALSIGWSSTLTAAQRSAWKSYAELYPRPNRWGTLTQSSGYLAYIRHNAYAARTDGGIPYHDAPSAPPLHPPELALTVQPSGAIVVTGTLDPNVIGTYLPTGTYNNHPYWSGTVPAGTWYISRGFSNWLLSDVIGSHGPAWWIANGPAPYTWYNDGTATGLGTSAWNAAASIAMNHFAPANYPAPPAALRLYVFAGDSIHAGRNYYQGPWHYATRIIPAFSTTPVNYWFPWPVILEAAHYTRAYAIAQDHTSRAMSTRAHTRPTTGNVTL